MVKTLPPKGFAGANLRIHETPANERPSRLNGASNLAVFDRAIRKLRVERKMKLIAAPGLATVLNDLRVGVIAPNP